MVKRASWLSVTPEPERELPRGGRDAGRGGGVRRLRRREPPSAARIERLVLRGSQRAWLSYLHGVVELIEPAPGDLDPEVVTRPRARDRRDLQPPQPAARASRDAARSSAPPTARDSTQLNHPRGNA